MSIDFEELGIYDEEGILKLEYVLSEGYDLDYALEHYEEVILYRHHNRASLMREFVEEGLMGILDPKFIRWIDFNSYGEELRHDGYVEYKGHVFKMD